MSANIALVKNWTLHGVFWGSYMQHNPRVLRGSLEQLAAWLGEGKLHVPVSHRCDASWERTMGRVCIANSAKG